MNANIMIVACREGQFDVVKYLCSIIPSNEHKYFKEAIEIARKRGDLDIVKYLQS